MPRTIDETAAEFGRFLRGLREARALSLRAVEQMTESKISNGYLSQLETGQVSRPSAVIIHTLAAAYGVDAGLLMEQAGLAPTVETAPNRLGELLGDVTPAERDELVRYLSFIRQRDARRS
jgi:transcriptional regulator with XRE-family HTH domain